VLHLNRKQINVEIGRLYLLNNAINLETNMLDTPEVGDDHLRSSEMHSHILFTLIDRLQLTLPRRHDLI
jgi:uncharacterized Rmd1/YagE family protein